MRDRDVVNYSAEDPRTRLSLDVLVTYESDIDEARTLIEESARSVDRVIRGGPDIRIGSARYPAAPTCYIESFADHGVLLTLLIVTRRLIPTCIVLSEDVPLQFLVLVNEPLSWGRDDTSPTVSELNDELPPLWLLNIGTERDRLCLVSPGTICLRHCQAFRPDDVDTRDEVRLAVEHDFSIARAWM